MDVVIASNNAHKVKEIKQILSGKFDKMYTLAELNIDCDPEENGLTFKDNALIKAREIAKYTDKAVLSDDTGLCVHALNGMPGVHSARYAGDHDHKKNRLKLLNELKDKTDRSAHFETVVVLHYPDGKELFGIGRVDGSIMTEEQGDKGFGYDNIFFCNDLNKGFGIATDEEKNSVSHRARALHDLLKQL